MTDTCRRVVVTGIGVVSPVGSTVPEAWAALLAGQSGIRIVPEYAANPAMRCHLAGQIQGFDIAQYLSPKEAQRLDTFCHYGVGAAQQAMDQAGLQSGVNFDPERAGVMVSSGIGGLSTITAQVRKMDAMSARQVSPLTIPMMISDMAAGFLGIRHQMKGPNFGVVSACATGLHAIGESAWIIRRGDAEVMLCGGTEASVVELGQAGFGSMRALSSRNDDPEHACRPFDATRDGFIPAAGAGVLVLEELSHALARGANILAEVAGYGATGDAYHITAPDSTGAGAARAIRIAMQHAGITPEQIGYVNAHGTSTPMNDMVETRALKAALGEYAATTPISSTKSMTGHMLGAAGGFESMVCIMGLLNGVVPGTMNLNTPDPECDLDYIPNTSRQLPDLRYALKVNMGFGGHNAAVIYSKYQG